MKSYHYLIMGWELHKAASFAIVAAVHFTRHHLARM